MGIVLFRIDERLVHGQVVLGWGRSLRPRRYAVVDDELAESDWEQDLYGLSLEAGTELLFLTVDEGRNALKGLRDDPDRTVILTRDAVAMARLARGGLMAGADVNVGGLHHRAGRVEVRPYIHLDPENRAALRELADEGVVVTGRDLPDTARVPLEALLG